MREIPDEIQNNTNNNQQQRTIATVLYLLTTSLLFADQNLLSPNLSAIAQEFGFNDIERDKLLGGDIAIAFFMVGVPVSFLVGCLADVVDRRSFLFLWVILVGEGSCLSTHWVKTYQQLYWCRALTGCSVGGALPLIYSVLGDYYEPKERGWVSGVISMACGFGISLGQGAAGFLGPKYGWRLPFLVVSLPAIVCAVSVWLLVPEVERGGSEKKQILNRRELNDQNDDRIEDEDRNREVEMAEKADNGDSRMRTSSQATSRTTLVGDSGPAYVHLDNEEESGNLTDTPTNTRYISRIEQYYNETIKQHVQTLKTLLKCPSVVLAVSQGAPGCIPWGIINTYLNDYLSSDRGLSVEGATLFILVFGFGNFLGVLIGGIGSSYLYEHHGPRYPAVLSSVSAIAGCFPLLGLINYDFNSSDGTTHFFVLGLISIIAGLLSGITGPIVKSTLQNVCMPQMRGQAFALLNILDDFGRGLGPAFVAILIEKMGGRRQAFNIGINGWIFCGILNGLLFFTVDADEEKVRLGIEQLALSENETEENNRLDVRSID